MGRNSLALLTAAATLALSTPVLAATVIPFSFTNSDVVFVGSPAGVSSRTLSGSGNFTFDSVIQDQTATLSDIGSFLADITYTVNFTGGSSATGIYHFTTADLTSLSSTFVGYLPTNFFMSTSAVSPSSGTLTVPLSLSINAPTIPAAGDATSIFAWPGGVQTLIAHADIQANVTGIPAVPELATWAMMLVGLGVIGFALRRAQQKAIVCYPGMPPAST